MCSGLNPATIDFVNIYILSDAASKNIIIEQTRPEPTKPNSTHMEIKEKDQL
jgi:hypothetical protein